MVEEYSHEEKTTIDNKLTFKNASTFSALFLLIGGVCSRLIIFPNSQIVYSFLSFSVVILAPLILGLSLLSISKILLKLHFTLGTFLSLFFSWLFGLTILTIGVMVSQYFSVFSANLFLLIIAISAIYNLFKLDSTIKLKLPKKRKSINLLLIALFAVIPVIVASTVIPYPLFGLGHDEPAALWQPIERATSNGYFTLSTETVQLEISFLSCFIFNVSPDGFLWFSRFFLEVIFAIGVYLFVKQITNKDTLAFISASIAPYILSGASGLDGTFMIFFDTPIEHLKSSTILFAIFPYMLYFVTAFKPKLDQKFKRTAKQLILPLIVTAGLFFYYNFAEYSYGFSPFYKPLEIDPLVIPSIATVIVVIVLFQLRRNIIGFSLLLTFAVFVSSLIHRSEFLLITLAISIYLLLSSLVKYSFSESMRSDNFLLRRLSRFNILRAAAILGFAFSYLINRLTTLGLVHLINLEIPFLFFFTGISPDLVQYSEIAKYNDFVVGNYFVLGLMAIGTVIIIIKYSKEHLATLLTLSALVLLFSLPFVYNSRLYKEIIPFMAITISIPLFLLLRKLSSIQIRKRIIKIVKPILFASTLVFLCVGLMSPLMTRYSIRDSSMPEANWQSWLSYDELETAEFIKANTPNNSLIISDPCTVWILTPLANRLWVGEKWMDRGDLPVYHHIKQNIFNASSANEAYSNLLSIDKFIPFSEKDFINTAGFDNITQLIVMSSRTISWIKKDDYPWFSSYSKQVNVDLSIPNHFLNEQYFKLTYSINHRIYVFQIVS